MWGRYYEESGGVIKEYNRLKQLIEDGNEVLEGMYEYNEQDYE